MSQKTKTRSYARLSLAIAAIGMIASLPFRHRFFGGLCYAGFEAGLVGGLADWFAVTALFRHPFHQSWIPHTAIIPKNRANIIAAIEDVIQNEWISLTVLQDKIHMISPLQLLTSFFGQHPEHQTRLIAGVKRLLIHFLAGVGLTPLLQKLLQWVYRHGHHEKILDFLLDELIPLVEHPDFPAKITPLLQKAGENYASAAGPLQKLSFWALDRFEVINYQAVAEQIQATLHAELLLMKVNPDHFLRQKLISFFPRLIEHLETNQELQNAIENSKLRIGRVSSNYLVQFGVNEWNQLMNDEEKRTALDAWLRDKLYTVIEQLHPLLGKLVRENLEKLDEVDFVRTIEMKIGNDLQWIRINGAAVGSLVGILLYLATYLLTRISRLSPWIS